MNAIGTLLRALNVITRDVFNGFIMGLCGAVLLVQFFTYTIPVAALAIPVGMASGIIKGMTKFFIFNYFSAAPTKGYRFHYPKFKLLAFWGAIFVSTMVFSYGFDLRAWYQEPLHLIAVNTFIGPEGKYVLSSLFWFTIVIGLASYLIDPPYDADEIVPQEVENEEAQ